MDLTYTLKKSPKRRTLAARLTTDGEFIVYAPMRAREQEINAFIERNKTWFQKRLTELEKRKKDNPPLSADEILLLKQAARRYLPERIRYFEALTGLRSTGFRVTSAKTRFGSCSAKNSLSFSLYLMCYPAECIDYVVLHEIAHIRHKDHSKSFHAFIASFMPDEAARRKRLKAPPLPTATVIEKLRYL